MISVGGLRRELRSIANPEKAKLLQRFFKTGKGEYAEGDLFLGIMVPQSREIAKKYSGLDLRQLKELIASKFHEERLIALFILINKYKTTNHKKIIFHFYLKNMKYINNWDLVDLSAPGIVGEHLYAINSRLTHSLDNSLEPSGNTSIKNKYKSFSSAGRYPLKDLKETLKKLSREESRAIDVLFCLANSKSIWERRIAVLATFQFVKYRRFGESLMLAEMLLNDQHDLIHKAVGWMLREVGKRDVDTEIEFLDKYSSKMPRTMLRYAIERFPEKLRMAYLKKK